MATEENLTWGGEYTVQYTDNVPQKCAFETYIILSTNVTTKIFLVALVFKAVCDPAWLSSLIPFHTSLAPPTGVQHGYLYFSFSNMPNLFSQGLCVLAGPGIFLSHNSCHVVIQISTKKSSPWGSVSFSNFLKCVYI